MTTILYIGGALILYLAVAWLVVGAVCKASARADEAAARMSEQREERVA